MCNRNLLSLEAYRGFARNMFAQGANGVYVFNYTYQWGNHWGLGYPGAMEDYPGKLRYLKALKTRAHVEAEDRHYPLRPFEDSACRERSQGFPYMRKTAYFFILSREPFCPQRGSGYYREYVFFAAEQFSRPQNGLIRFAVTNMVPGDRMAVFHNGVRVPEEDVTWTHFPGGRTCSEEGQILGPYARGEFTPFTPAEPNGRNTLGLELIGSADGTRDTERLALMEIDLAVSVFGHNPEDIMEIMQERQDPAMSVLAGYHPPLVTAAGDTVATQDIGSVQPAAYWEDSEASPVAAKLGQSFVLQCDETVAWIDMLLGPTREPIVAKDAVRMTLCLDDGGIPCCKPVADGMTVFFVPWENPCAGLTLRFEGYYKFVLPEAVNLGSGAYWIVIEKQATTSHSDFCYRARLTRPDRYQPGHVAVWHSDSGGWESKPYTTFFGVH